MIRSELLDRTAFFIDGGWQRADDRPRHIQFEAATEEVLGVVSVGGSDDVDRAVASARAALDSGPWGRTSPPERAEFMRRLADALERRGAETAELVSRENGTLKSLSHAANVVGGTSMLRTLADFVASHEFEVVRPSRAGETLVRREPVGVVGAITTWNYPVLAVISKVAPALAAGCTLVVKPPLDCALDAYVVADAAEEIGLPPGVLNIVVGGQDAAQALVAHPDVDMIAFTGSTATGRAIGEVAGRMFKRMTLELGGKSAAIVLPDANVDDLVRTAETALFKNGGQTCTTHSRVIVHRSRRDEVIDALRGLADGFVIGDPLDSGVTLGPMATEHHRDRVEGYIRLGLAEGAGIASGGPGRPEGVPRGWFVRPTVFTGVSNDSRLAQEEVFGPVIAVIEYDDEDDAVAMANATPFGLAGMVLTGDEAHGLEVAGRIRSGTVGVNYYSLDTGSPFGGVKSSGIGREFGPEGLDAYLEYKSIYVRPKTAD
ncbi:aldehyde dehydrogenase [Amycolatopsis orientalis]|uniref:Aldehyde dehydrogenase n=1 Tax=Amycolatopsis orientalis TaxID=31958 RepID=A0A193BUJ6_AMYOR|nr:aldehyde dehydrogenase [Amycolatopsis orientalis]ANN15849.1 aldehyde dehydrogenase [Amycolatopsis orientalis]